MNSSYGRIFSLLFIFLILFLFFCFFSDLEMANSQILYGFICSVDYFDIYSFLVFCSKLPIASIPLTLNSGFLFLYSFFL